MNQGQEALRRIVLQMRSGGGPKGGPGKGAFAGGGLLAAVIGGAFLINSSLFNGACHIFVSSLLEAH
jgi:prohibitin 2